MAVLGCITPLIPLFPPGIIFFLLYRNIWRLGRFLRAERDILRLPLRYFDDSAQTRGDLRVAELPGGQLYGEKKFPSRLEAVRSEKVFTRAPIRSVSLYRRSPRKYPGVTGFAGYKQTDDQSGRFAAVKDPMAETLLIPGDPEQLTDVSARQAHLMELGSIFLFSLGFFVNSGFLYALLLLLIK